MYYYVLLLCRKQAEYWIKIVKLYIQEEGNNNSGNDIQKGRTKLGSERKRDNQYQQRDNNCIVSW